MLMAIGNHLLWSGIGRAWDRAMCGEYYPLWAGEAGRHAWFQNGSFLGELVWFLVDWEGNPLYNQNCSGFIIYLFSDHLHIRNWLCLSSTGGHDNSKLNNESSGPLCQFNSANVPLCPPGAWHWSRHGQHSRVCPVSSEHGLLSRQTPKKGSIVLILETRKRKLRDEQWLTQGATATD